MTIATEIQKVTANGNGTATVFSFSPVVLFSASNLVVTKVAASGAETILAQGTGTTNYSVTVSSYPGTGFITYPASGASRLQSGEKVVMKRVLPIVQTTDLENQGGYFPEVLENELDYIVAVEQQLNEKLGRAILFADGDTGTDVHLPPAAERANHVLAFDSNGDPIAGATADAVVSSAMEPVVSAASIEAAAALLGVSSAMTSVTGAASIDAARQALGVHKAGTVFMLPNEPRATPATWSVYLPDGTKLDTTGTTTSGLQEAIDYVCEHGYDFVVLGGGVEPSEFPPPYDPVLDPGLDRAELHFSTPIVVPPLQKAKWHFGAVTFNYDTTSGTAWVWDSFELFSLDSVGCQFVANTPATVMAFAPSGEWPQDPYGPSGVSADIRLGAVVNVGAGVGLSFDTSTAPIQWTRFFCAEVLGGSTGVQVTGDTGFIQNVVTICSAHGQSAINFSIGTGSSDVVYGNIFNIGSVLDTGVLGIDYWGQGDTVNASVVGSGLAGLKLESTAQGAIFNISTLSGTTPLTDLSTARDCKVNIGGQDRVSVHRNASNQSIPDATETKIAFTTEEYDRAGTFNTTTYRWVPGLPGYGRIEACATFAETLGDGVHHSIMIYRNGSLYKQKHDLAGANNANSCVHIACSVIIDNATDYFEVFVFHEAGGAKNLDGAPHSTWAMFTREG